MIIVRFVNDKVDQLWSFCALMTHSYPIDADSISPEMRGNIIAACEAVNAVTGVYVYRAAMDDDVDCFMMQTPSGYVLTLSSEAAKKNTETLEYFVRQADLDAWFFGPEVEINIMELNREATTESA